jgi:C-terminal processing protease CtpA/Prc
MNKLFYFCIIIFSGLLVSCAAGKPYSPAKKFPQEALQKDFIILKEILQKKHPGLYWYTSRDSMDMYFTKYYNAIKDSMTDQQFAWQIMAPLVDKIHCGHTSVGSSKAYQKWIAGKRLPSFPLFLKVWNDSMAVSANLNRKDSIFKRGTLITSINGVSNTNQVNKMFDYLPEDGFANNVNYIRLSGNFPYYHRNIYGLSRKYQVTYLDNEGQVKKTEIPLYTPAKDSTKKTAKTNARQQKPATPKRNKLQQYRSLEIDSAGHMATLTLNTFNKGMLRIFFKNSFRELRKKNINHLVLDLRSNGGGKVNSSTLLTKYISRKPFKVADSVYAVSKGLGKYARYIKGGWLNNLEMFFISRKRKDGQYHIGMLEKRKFHPKKNNHYNGNVYVLISGPTFSASTLFCNAIKGQPGITLVGEETGGGWHGNSGIMIPDIKLPHTKNTVRLPLYRLVQYNHVPKTGSGIMPDIYVGTNYDALLKGVDYKMKVVRELIEKQQPYVGATKKNTGK